MSILVAIESSGKPLSLALFKGNDLLEEFYKEPDGRGHAETLLPLFDALLSRHQLTLPQVNQFAVAVGPGSYTSLRVGLATLKGLLARSDALVHPVSTLEALAFAAETKAEFLIPVLPSGRGRVYGAVFRRSNQSLELVLDECILSPEEFLQKIAPYSKNAFLAGVGVSLLGETGIPSGASQTPRAAAIGRLALQNASTPVPASELTARYLQEPDFG